MNPSSENKNVFISFKNAALRVGDSIVFSETNWEFHNDEHWAIIGPNGSGKSILAIALSGQIPVVQGKIVYHFLKKQPQGPFPDQEMVQGVAVAVQFDFTLARH